MATELGVAYLSIIPETSKIAPGVKKALGDSSTGRAADGAGRSIGTRLSSSMKKTMGVAAKATGAVVAGTLGLSLAKGFSRLKGIEQAEAKLTGLGHSAKVVDKIMGNALASVKGTAFGLDEAATSAAGAVAAGVKPGRDLQRTLKLVADAATIAGVDMGEMGAIFNKVAASNKIQGDVIAQLNDAGIPIIQLLGKELGKTAEETVKLASAGKINFDTFRNAMQQGLGGAAQESGKTVTGAFANMQAALGRLGASVLSGIFSKLPTMFGNVTAQLDKLGPVAVKVGETLGRGLSAGIKAAQRLVKAIQPVVQTIGSKLSPVIAKVNEFFKKNPEVIKGAATALGILAGALTAVALAMAAVSLAASPITLVILGIAALGGAIAYAYKNSETFRTVVQTLGEQLQKFGTWVVSTLVPAVVSLAQAVAQKLQPVWKALGTYFTGTILPILQKIGAKLREWWPTIQTVIQIVAKMIAWWVKFQATIAGKVIPIMIKVSGFLLRTLVPAVLAVISVFVSLVRGAINMGSAVGRAFSTLTLGARVAYNGVKRWLGNALDFIRGMPGKIKSLFSGIWDGLANGLKTAINAVLHLPIKIPEVDTHIPGVGKVGGQTLIPALAKGTNFFQGGMALVGEKGPELVELPRGAKVTTAAKTRARLNNSKATGAALIRNIIKGMRGAEGNLAKALARVTKQISKALANKQITKNVAKHYRNLVATITKQLNKLNKLVAARREMAKSITDSLKGEFDLSSLVGTNEFGLSVGPGAAVDAAKALAARMKAFAVKLAALVKAGMPPALINEIAGYGSEEGSRVADVFLQASKAQMKSLRSSFSTFNTYASAAGFITADATYGARIDKQEAKLEKAIERGLAKSKWTLSVGKNAAGRIVAEGQRNNARRK